MDSRYFTHKPNIGEAYHEKPRFTKRPILPVDKPVNLLLIHAQQPNTRA
jgi:hypothetical protein